MKYKETKVIKFLDISVEYQQEVFDLAEDSAINLNQRLPHYYGIELCKTEAKFNGTGGFVNYLLDLGFEKKSTVIIQEIRYVHYSNK